MAERAAWSLAEGLWGIAFAALALAALLGPGDSQGVASVAAVGHLLWGAALAIDARTGDRGPASGGRRLTAAILAAPLAAEGAGAALALIGGQADHATWYLLGLTFAAAGVVTALRRVPTDSVLACQLYFHFLMTFPVLAAVFSL